MESSRRIAWVDYAKGIAIIGVFILHSNAPEDVIHVVDAFCMPLFFLLSGFVFSIRRYCIPHSGLFCGTSSGR